MSGEERGPAKLAATLAASLKEQNAADVDEPDAASAAAGGHPWRAPALNRAGRLYRQKKNAVHI
ncbi:MAG: hypothetical protein LBJ14_05340 [Desulfarculales bacterium]|jgi:hypothetical protein|nr:hypothetical protein [Desulfarculales bacterium]